MKKVLFLLMILILVLTSTTLVACEEAGDAVEFVGGGGLLGVFLNDLSESMNGEEYGDVKLLYSSSLGGYVVKGLSSTSSGSKIVIPEAYQGDRIVSIDEKAFSDSTGLTSVSLPDSVTSIGDNAFAGCSGLVSFRMGSGVKSIGKKAFSDCVSLTSISLPDSVTRIGDKAFSGCFELSSVIIGTGVEWIGSSVFNLCDKLKGLTYCGSQSAWAAVDKSDGWDHGADLRSITCLG